MMSIDFFGFKNPAFRRAADLARLRRWPGIEEQPERALRFSMLLRAGLVAYCEERMESPQKEWSRSAMALARAAWMEQSPLEKLNFATGEWLLIEHLLARVKDKDGQASHPLTMSYLRSLAPGQGMGGAAKKAWSPPASLAEMTQEELEVHGSNAMNVTKISWPATEVLAQAERMGLLLTDSFFDEDPRAMNEEQWAGWAKASAEAEVLEIGAYAQSAASLGKNARL